MAGVLFIVPYLYGGGTEHAVSVWAGGLAERGLTVHVLVFYRRDAEYALNPNVHLHAVAGREKTYRRLGAAEKILRIRAWIRRIQPDIVLPFVAYAGIMTMMAAAGQKTGIVETVRNDPKHESSGPGMRALRALAIRSARRCIVQTEGQLRQFPQGMRGRMEVLGNPVGQEFADAKKVFAQPVIRNIVSSGRLEAQKNHALLLNAFADASQEFPHLRLTIYGEGSLQAELQAQLCRLRLQGRAQICGPRDDMARALLDADLFVLSSDYEGMPNSLLEAMAVGLPCISTDCPTGPSDLMEDGVSGLLVPAGSREALAGAILRMAGDPSMAIAMGQRARAHILETHSAQASADKLAKILACV